MQFTHIRHGSHLLVYNGIRILVDPVLAESGAYQPIPFSGSQAMNPLLPLPIEIGTLLDVDAVLISHLHNDHFDEAAKCIIPKDMLIWCHHKDADKIRSFGFANVTGINSATDMGCGIRLTPTKGRHGYGPTAKAMGHVSGFILQEIPVADQFSTEPVVHIIGDSVWYPDLEKALQLHHPDIVIVFAGEARICRSKPITMGIQDLEKILETLPDATLIAIHMDAWNHCSLTREALREHVVRQGHSSRIMIPENGESYSLKSNLKRVP